jgi:hypothetical protein
MPVPERVCVCLCVRRALCRVKMRGQDDPIHLNNPTAAAVASLSSNFPYSEPFLNSFFRAGGVLALQKVLRESSCPLAIGNAVCFITQILLGEDRRKMKWRRQIALDLYHAGEQSPPGSMCSAGDQVLGHVSWRNLLWPLLSLSKHVASEISQSAVAM